MKPTREEKMQRIKEKYTREMEGQKRRRRRKLETDNIHTETRSCLHDVTTREKQQ